MVMVPPAAAMPPTGAVAVTTAYSHRPALFSAVAAPLPVPVARVEPVPSPYVSSFVVSKAASCICMTMMRSPVVRLLSAPDVLRVPTTMLVAPALTVAVPGQ